MLEGEWESDDAPPEACPFCSGQRVHPEDANFITGYTRGLQQAQVKRLTWNLTWPLIEFKRADLDLKFITELDEDAAKGLCRQRGDVLLGKAEKSILEILKERDGKVSEMVLTLSLAKKFLKDSESVAIDEFCTIDDAAAMALSTAKEGLNLLSLVTLSDAAAVALAKLDDGISLAGLTTLSDRAAVALGKHKGGLMLNRLTSLSDVAAAALAKHEGQLRLTGLTELSVAGAKALLANGSVETNLDLKKIAAGDSE